MLSRYWHNGFLPSKHQGVQFQSRGDPVLYLSNPAGIDRANRARIVQGAHMGLAELSAADGADNSGAMSTLLAALLALRDA